MKKKISTTVLFIFILTAIQAYSFAAVDMPTARVQIGGVPVVAEAYVMDEMPYLPLRAVAEAAGYKVGWAPQKREITITGKGINMTINLKNSLITVNDHSFRTGGDYSGIRWAETMFFGNKAYIQADFFEDNFRYQMNWDKKNGIICLNLANENTIQIKTAKIQSENDLIRITAQYPQLSGLADKAVQDGLNKALKQFAQKAVDEGKANVEEQQTQGVINKKQFEIYFNYRIKYNRNNLLSVVFNNCQYTGGAHGLTVQSSHTFSLVTGDEFKLEDLSAKGTELTAAINKAVGDMITELVGKNHLSKPSVPFKSIKANPDYYLSNSAVVIYFQEYEYFPYGEGIREFPVAVSDLKDVIRPLDTLANNQVKLLENSGAKNILKVGETGRVVLKGNETTGYTWHYQIGNEQLLKLTAEKSVPDSSLIGAGSMYYWDFQALKTGNTQITFKYYRDWEGEASTTAENTKVYSVTIN